MKFKIRNSKDKDIVVGYVNNLPEGKVFTAEIKVKSSATFTTIQNY